METLGALLIVDDDPDVVRAARVVMAPHAERIFTAGDITDLEKEVTRQALDAVLLDMNFLPGERSGQDGLMALARIRRCDPHLSVVLMTGFGGVTLAVAALKQGGVDFVLKPWRNEKLLETVIAAAQLTKARRNAETLDLEALERAAIERALARHQGNISLAASTLGLSRASLYRRLSKHGL
jgi:DNA-binding NtrC family response regulator